MNILCPGSAASLPQRGCVLGGIEAEGLRKGQRLWDLPAPPSFQGKLLCCSTCGAFLRARVPEAQPREPALWLPDSSLIHCRVLLVELLFEASN